MRNKNVVFVICMLLFFSCSKEKPEDIYEKTDKDTVSAVDDEINDTVQEKDDEDSTDSEETLTDEDEVTDSSDSDEFEWTTDPCSPNPCIMENSDGNCTVDGKSFFCGCNENYLWSDYDCIPDTCTPNPCLTIENSTDKCTTANEKYVCECDSGYYWNETICDVIPDIVYVKADASGLNNGTSWKNAFKDFTDAIDSIGEPISKKWMWVAKGIYKPKREMRAITLDPCNNGNICFNFTLINNVTVFGGFSGNETSVEQRNWTKNETIFSGDIDNSSDISSGDVYHVFLNYNIDNSAVIDGVVIENGNAAFSDGGVEDKHMLHGGGMNNWGNADPVIRNVLFRNNNAKLDGGGLAASYESNAIIENCTFENNMAFKGGALSVFESNPTIVSSVFRNNKTDEGYGGAVVIEEADPYFYDCLFINNNSEDGGAALIFQNSESEFENCRFIENNANRNGGAIGIAGYSNPEINNCYFESNLAEIGGGAIEIYDGSEPMIINSKFFTNKVSGLSKFRTGGAILVSDSQPYFIGSLFAGNSADAGGAISNRKGTPILLNCTIIFNYAAGELGFGGAMYSETSSTPTIINSILWYNRADNYDPEISNDLSTPTISFSNIRGSLIEGEWNEYMGIDETNNMDSEPKFVNPEIGNFTLFEESPCINAGNNTPYETGNFAENILEDLLGNDRIIDGKVDMGAYESRK